MDARSSYHDARATAPGTSNAPASASEDEKPFPVDLSHYFSKVSKARVPSRMKEYYKLFLIPGIGNLAGGLPNRRFFPFDTLEAQTAKPERWTPTPNYPDDYELIAAPVTKGGGNGSPSSPPSETDPDPSAASHIAVPSESSESDMFKRIDLATALQYGLAQGYPPLLSWIRQFTRENLHPNVPYRDGPEVVLTCGSTDGFSKTLDLFVDSWSEGDDITKRPGILCETFVYASILSQSQPRGVQFAPVTADEGGMLVKGEGALEDVLANWDPARGRRPHLMYTVTLGHNPSGIVLSVERRKEIYAVCSKYDVIIVEDEPYWYLQFPSAAIEEAKARDQPLPPSADDLLSESSSSSSSSSSEEGYTHGINGGGKSSGYEFLDSLTPSFLSIDTEGRVVRLDTFSKTIAPGCRLGWITAQPELIDRYVRIAESSTQQPSGFVQAMVAELVMGPQPAATTASFMARRTPREKAAFSGWKMDGWVRWLSGLRGMYERRMARMCRILDAGMYQLKTGTPVRAADADWGVVTKTQLFDYKWPRGGMFVWLRMSFENHPLWQAPGGGGDIAIIDGPVLGLALMMFLTTKPYLALVSVGSMFSASDEIRAKLGWAWYRLCFAAESEEKVDATTQGFVDGVHKFWRIKSVEEIEKYYKLSGATASADVEDLSMEMAQLGAFMGC
ncbi:aromatic amino acid aminotransferase 1 [Bombardia bombarda]|uniref:Aromatic amino acid aminotransferase 1 n=1 Tax=Bombardia bombarda TaxID=252184 RepID=A0AA39XLQ3_9PEZI|nr:aromatic amino acid aminotransferase 1 [Bombardia bombarda]